MMNHRNYFISSNKEVLVSKFCLKKKKKKKKKMSVFASKTDNLQITEDILWFTMLTNYLQVIILCLDCTYLQSGLDVYQTICDMVLLNISVNSVRPDQTMPM